MLDQKQPGGWKTQLSKTKAFKVKIKVSEPAGQWAIGVENSLIITFMWSDHLCEATGKNGFHFCVFPCFLRTLRVFKSLLTFINLHFRVGFKVTSVFRLFPSFTNPTNQSTHTPLKHPDCFHSIPKSFITLWLQSNPPVRWRLVKPAWRPRRRLFLSDVPKFSTGGYKWNADINKYWSLRVFSGLAGVCLCLLSVDISCH